MGVVPPSNKLFYKTVVFEAQSLVLGVKAMITFNSLFQLYGEISFNGRR
jgi:hypothetical protein